MHRHGYKGTKFGRERGQRRALLKSLSEALILNESLETTLPKAKAVASYTEKLITKAKAGGLANRRRVISSLSTLEAAHKLVDEISPKLTERNSGYFRVIKTSARQGDNALMAKVSFVDDLSKAKSAKSEPEAIKPTTKPAAKQKADDKPKKKTASARPQASRRASGSSRQVNQAAKRTGKRGNK